MMEFRLAAIADTADIARLIFQTWNTPAHDDQIIDILSRPDAPVWIATSDAGFAGFCAGFMTSSHAGTPRWEVDLLAVTPESRGQGIGRNLVARSVESGRERGAALCRGLIAVDNGTSARCFEVNGFRADAICNLWIGPPAAHQLPSSPYPDRVHLIPVETLTYRGIWVEGRYDTQALAAAQQMALSEGRNTVGAVIPDGMGHDGSHLQFAHIDTYKWWILRA